MLKWFQSDFLNFMARGKCHVMVMGQYFAARALPKYVSAKNTNTRHTDQLPTVPYAAQCSAVQCMQGGGDRLLQC